MEALHVAPGSYGSRRYSSIIVLDEIDMLMTRDQAVSVLLGTLEQTKLWQGGCRTHVLY
jgi:Cdc6-like AAA superfamily ATPase